MNPWDTNINFGFDEREFTPERIKAMSERAPIESRFFLGGYSYHTVRFLYNIDPFMELEVKKTILMELQPQVLRYSGIKDARKMTESLRDGIYLLKVGIQKSYLDPRDNTRWLLRNTPQFRAELVSMGGQELATKEFITTNMALVRVVDGLIIYPIELTMRDLRLMRTRANFLFQLETVDERLIQAYHVFREQGLKVTQIEEELKKFRETMEFSDAVLNPKGPLPESMKPIVEQRDRIRILKDRMQARQDLEAKVKETQDLVSKSLQLLARRLQVGGPIGTYLNSAGHATDVTIALGKDTLIAQNFQLNEELLNSLKSAMNLNDFSKISLPRKEEGVDLNIFIEPNSGLERRTFVGPVIFLSNAYGDSARATDNLDEANCWDPTKSKDALRLGREAMHMNMLEEERVQAVASGLNGNRQNNAYQHNKFFSSLNHLCFKHVDDLISEEVKLKNRTRNAFVAASLKHNFVNSFNFPMDYISLTGEPLKKVRPDCKLESPGEGVDPAKTDVAGCLVDTDDNTISSSVIDSLVNRNMGQATRIANSNWNGLIEKWRGVAKSVSKKKWTPEDYDKLFFSDAQSLKLDGESGKDFVRQRLESNVALCNLVSNHVARSLVSQRMSSMPEYLLHSYLVDSCLKEGGLIHDVKLRVEQTGDYMFLGGLNLNVNVGESFSVGTSRSWSAGVELTDFIGAFKNGKGDIGKLFGKGKTGGDDKFSPTGFASTLLKPFSLKWGQSLGESEGTNVSESTYLVSQIAKFDVELLSYEKCAVVRLSDQAVKRFAAATASGGDLAVYGAIGIVGLDFSKEEVLGAVKRGLFVCEGDRRVNNKPRRVEEMYFYFTQHFTEGDMLDQADLYNHPWLLGLRGWRDFSIFLKKIRAQQVVDLPGLLKGLVGWSQPRELGWALEHMFNSYRNVLPSFPGFLHRAGIPRRYSCLPVAAR
ncbi:MAG: hypothetical protein HC902_02560, partial [Calothrix sp. SM1_5_4]|nr:hypothetical protein [Calothrix sp. SM1_5_4]